MDNGSGHPVSGVIAGIVSDLDDPERLGRVKVTFPDLEHVSSDWARIVAPSAGSGRGVVFRPQRGDEVVVAFERGDMRAPYVLGGVWSSADPPPKDDEKPADNNWRFITSRSGHVIRLDDTPGAERIEVIDKDGARKVVLDSAKGKITVDCATGDIDVSAGTGTVQVTGDMVKISATSKLTLHSDGAVEITGPSIDLN